MGRRVDPEVAVAEMRAHGFEPIGPFPGAHELWDCTCLYCGAAHQVRLVKARSRNGCPACGRRRISQARSLDPKEAVARMRAGGMEPLEPYVGVHTPWRSRCLRCGTEGRPRLAHVQVGGTGCRVCGRAKSDQARRIDHDKAAAVMKAAGLEPLVLYPGGHTPWPCRCVECGATLKPHYRTVVTGGGCANCARIRARERARTPRPSRRQHDIPYFGLRLPEEEVVAAMRAAGVEPLEPYPGAGKRWLCRCLTCGLEGHPVYNNVRRGQGACQHCRTVKSIATRLERKAPKAKATLRKRGLEPLEPYPGRFRHWMVRCGKCQSSVPVYYGRIAQGSGCPLCSTSGYKRDKPAFVYLLTHDEWKAHKIGIANLTSKRVEKHARVGWRLVHRIDCSGEDALRIEAAVLTWWRDELGFEPCLDGVDGWTETVSSALVTTDDIWQRVENYAQDPVEYRSGPTP